MDKTKTQIAVEKCFRIDKQNRMLEPLCNECPYKDYSTDCVRILVSDVKRDLSLLATLLDEVHEQRSELRMLRSRISKYED